MLQFTYRAVDRHGKVRTGRLGAWSRRCADEKLKKRGWAPSELKAQPARAWASIFQRSVGTIGEAFARDLGSLLAVGVPIHKALITLEASPEADGALRGLIRGITEALEAGARLSFACGRYRQVFDPTLISLLRAGEATGSLAVSLQTWADLRERARALRSKVLLMALYPLCVLCVAVGVVWALGVYVVPQLSEVFETSLHGNPLPWATRWILGAVSASEGTGLTWLIGILAAVAGLRLGGQFKVFRRAIRYVADKLPIYARVRRSVEIAAWSESVGVMLSGGVGILEAISLSAQALPEFSPLRIHAGAISKSITQGCGFVQACLRTRAFPSTWTIRVEVGEHGGRLADALISTAAYFRNDVEHRIALALKLLEPAMIILLAGIVGTVVLGFFIPLMDWIGGL